MPGHLFEGNPVDEGTTRRGTATPVHRPQRPAGSTHSSTRGLRPPEQLESILLRWGLSTEVGVQGLGPQPGGEAAVGHRLRVETTLPVGLSAVGECSPRHGSVLSP